MKQTLIVLLTAGPVLILVGILIAMSAWPETIPGYESSFSSALDTEDVQTGSWLGVFIGGVLALAGQIMVAVAVIALGVHVGTKDRVATPNP